MDYAAVENLVRLHLQGEIQEAEKGYRALILKGTRAAIVYRNLAVICISSERTDEALGLLETAIELEPAFSDAHRNQSIALRNLGRTEDAVAALQRAIDLNPNDPQLLRDLAGLLRNQHDVEGELECWRRLAQLTPTDHRTTHTLASVLYSSGAIDESIPWFERTIELQPQYPYAYLNLARVLTIRHRDDEATGLLKCAIRLKPDFQEAHLALASNLSDRNDPEQAQAHFQQAVALRPDHARTLCAYGNFLRKLKHQEKALEILDRAVAQDSTDPEIFNVLGNILRELNRFEEALIAYDRAISIKPGNVDALNNRGTVLFDLNRHQDALESYQRAIASDPACAEAHYHIGLLKLLYGEFETGFEKYEWRWKNQSFKQQQKGVREFPQPLWIGVENLRSKTILLQAEQGLGDTIQFCRYARLAASQSATVLLEVPSALAKVLRGLRGVDKIIPCGEPLPEFDYHCPLLSLPRAFGTLIETIPAEPNYLEADPEQIVRWSARLGSRRPKVGLVWSGNAAHLNDRNRSMPLEILLRGMPPGIELFSLQKDVRESDRPHLTANNSIIDFTSDLHDFTDMAALISLLDLVITVDTATAHLAGALGQPTWLLLPYAADWRWMLGRNDSPWYPSMRLFRQPSLGDWNAVMSTVKQELSATFMPE